jgi:septum formation protein
MPATAPRLILASTSPYRKALLERLGLPFTVTSPELEETHFPGEAPEAMALRLAGAKAGAVAALHPDALVIGSDQVAALDGAPIGKPGSVERARAQLARASGRAVVFHTAVALATPSGSMSTHVDQTRVRFRALGAAEIARYVELDRPLDCAGSFRSEGLGIALFEAIDCHDPSALIGLPLIWVAAALRAAGLDPLGG